MTQTYDHMGSTLEEWERRLGDEPSGLGETLTGDELAGLDEPVQRHLSRAIAAGTPLARCARLTMRGSIRIGRWLPFRATQILRPHTGFIWSARVAGLIAGSDRYLDGAGEMDWTLAGLVRLVHADGADVSASAAGRCGAEAIWLPTVLLPRFGVTWSAHDERHLGAGFVVDDTAIDLRLHLNPSGGLASLAFDRWGDPDRSGRWGWYPFGGTFARQRDFGGLRIPSAGRLGWHYGTDRWTTGEFFRYEITDLRPLGA